ncbi:uncharacterized protein [Panulirus ornatus]|uniref:uncharacterized protein n=1 Tax=Panulirus ornatus TaxID=150431 RepID=UPI003A8B4BDE
MWTTRDVTLLLWAGVTAWLASLVLPVTPTVTSDLFFKVSNPVFPDLTLCKLETWPLSAKLPCATQCQRTSQCSMFCLSGGQCDMYSARVGRNWVGEGNPLAGVCYSSWGSGLMSSASIAASVDYSEHYKGANAIDGFYCSGLSNCYCSQGLTKTYLAISLGDHRRVVAVKVQTTSGYFRGVEVRVGNFSDPEDGFSANVLLRKLTEVVPSSTVITLHLPAPVVASVVSFLQETESTYHLCICDVQVYVE